VRDLVLTPMETLGALIVTIMLARTMWLLMHTTQHSKGLSVAHWNHEVERASGRWSGAKIPVRR